VKDFTLLQNVHTCSRVHPASYAMGTGIYSRGVKRPGRKVNHTFSSSAEVKKKWGCKSTPPLRPRGVDRENLPLNFAINIFIKQYFTESKTTYGSK